MDMNFVYILIITALTIGGTFGIKYLKSNKILSQSDLILAGTILGISSSVLSQMNVSKCKELPRIVEVISMALKTCDTDNVYDLVLQLCYAENLTVNEETKIIIKQILDIL